MEPLTTFGVTIGNSSRSEKTPPTLVMVPPTQEKAW
jgi:hypothetical protein